MSLTLCSVYYNWLIRIEGFVHSNKINTKFVTLEISSLAIISFVRLLVNCTHTHTHTHTHKTHNYVARHLHVEMHVKIDIDMCTHHANVRVGRGFNSSCLLQFVRVFEKRESATNMKERKKATLAGRLRYIYIYISYVHSVLCLF